MCTVLARGLLAVEFRAVTEKGSQPNRFNILLRLILSSAGDLFSLLLEAFQLESLYIEDDSPADLETFTALHIKRKSTTQSVTDSSPR